MCEREIECVCERERASHPGEARNLGVADVGAIQREEEARVPRLLYIYIYIYIYTYIHIYMYIYIHIYIHIYI